jgi:predicted N-acetyltransferase YhbS
VRSTIKKWIRYLLESPWDAATAPSRLRPLRFRVATKADFPACEALHHANEAHGVPANHREHYAAALRGGSMLTLMVEENGSVVGCCGLQWSAEPGVAWLTYGLVVPELHRKGIGTTMFLARLSLLPDDGPDLTLVISALETSLPYYRRFGFQLVGRFDSDEDGNRYPVAVLTPVNSRMIQEAREKLAAAGAFVPDVTDAIPRAKAPEPAPAIPGINGFQPR